MARQGQGAYKYSEPWTTESSTNATDHLPGPYGYRPADPVQAIGFARMNQDPTLVQEAFTPRTQNEAEAGQPQQPGQPQQEGNKVTVAFSEKSIRAAFIRKVFALVTLMLLLVAAQVSVAVFVNPVNAFLQTTTSLIIMGCLDVFFIVIYCAIICGQSLRRTFPINIILAFTLAFCLGYLVATLATCYEVQSITICTALLVVSCGSICIFSMQTRFDMVSCYGVCILLTIYLLFISLVSFCFVFWIDYEWLNTLYAVIACTLFMIYLAIDIQLIMGGGRVAISPEEYIFAAVQIFIDVVYIFIYLLRIFGKVK